jgi:hypothetical protein
MRILLTLLLFSAQKLENGGGNNSDELSLRKLRAEQFRKFFGNLPGFL